MLAEYRKVGNRDWEWGYVCVYVCYSYLISIICPVSFVPPIGQNETGDIFEP